MQLIQKKKVTFFLYAADTLFFLKIIICPARMIQYTFFTTAYVASCVPSKAKNSTIFPLKKKKESASTTFRTLGFLDTLLRSSHRFLKFYSAHPSTFLKLCSYFSTLLVEGCFKKQCTVLCHFLTLDFN